MNIKSLTVLPISLGLMLFPSLKYSVLLDGASTNYYGFPIPWYSDSLVTSLAHDVYLVPLVIDLLVYFGVGYFLWKVIGQKLLQLPTYFRGIFIVLVWLYGLFALFMMVARVTIEPASSIQLWPDSDIFEIESIELSHL